MTKRYLIIVGVFGVLYLQAQDVSVITNTVDVYSNTQNFGSAKYNAMAGANGALGGDASSLLTNPAGLGVAISSEISFTPIIEAYKNSSTLNGNSIDYKKSKFNLGNFGGVMTFPLMTETPWKFVNLGVNISTKSLDNYVETPDNSNITISKNLLDPSGNPVVGQMSYLGHAYNRTGRQSLTNIGVGANYDNRLYFGAGINVQYSELEQYDTAIFGLDIDNSSTFYDKQYTPYTEQSSGASFSLGVIGKINNQLRLGASIESPVWWQQERIYNNYYYNDIGDMYYDVYSENRNFQSPMKATVSAAFVPNKNFAINVDYSLGLTKPKYSVDGPAETELNDFFKDNYKNISEVKVGAEYRIKAFRLRGGYAFSSNPFTSITMDAYANNGNVEAKTFDNLMISQRNTFGLGIGYDFKSFYVDASYQNINSTYDNPFLSGYEDYGTGYYSGDSNYSIDVTTPNSVVSEVKTNRNNFFLTLGWKF